MTDPRSGEESLSRRIWDELERAVVSPGHGWRTPVLATVDEAGVPRARTIVMRGANGEKREILFYTDARSPKAAQLRSSGQAALVFWDGDLGWQLRIAGECDIDTDGPAVETIWRQITGTPAALDYLAPAPPGSRLEMPETAKSREHHLAVVTVSVGDIDWLELNDRGHRRALISGNSVEWLIP